jgi:nicotinate phosphoribosyltransferase
MSEYLSTPISSNLDQYKFYMGDFIHEYHPEESVTFTLNNRSKERPLSAYVSPDALSERFEEIRDQGFGPEEIAYLAGLKAQNGTARFTESYLNHLEVMHLPEVLVDIDTTSGELHVETTGPWQDVSIWETIVMSEVNELYYQNLLKRQGLSLRDVYDEGDARLDEKIALLKRHPHVTFADFGTRRRFSRRWHEHVIERVARELPEQFIGTSNPWFAYTFGLPAIGTNAHELPMIYAGLADAAGRNPLAGQGEMLEDWGRHYHSQRELLIALPDTFGSDYFFQNFAPEQAELWGGFRHDSGDPYLFTEKVLRYYTRNGIDPMTKKIIYSDSLTAQKMVDLSKAMAGRIMTTNGIGTNFTNDLGISPVNSVMKPTEVNGWPTVKISDDMGKYTGPTEYVKRYQQAAERPLYADA